MYVGYAAVASHNPRRFLPPVLQGIQRKKRMARHIAAGSVNTKDAALFVRLIESVVLLTQSVDLFAQTSRGPPVA